jgi:ATPase family associated with various cellular activities (AAA)
MLSFEKLTEARRSLQSFCLLHVPSLISMQSGICFKKLMVSEEGSLDDGELHHPTNTATCLSSLFDCPPRYSTTEFKRAVTVKSGFSAAAFRRTKWESEGSAGVYCRCRAFPAVITFSDSFDERIETHLREILGQLDKATGRFGIGEAGATLPDDQWYPPNAFHTYWTLKILDLMKAKPEYKAEYERLSDPKALDLNRKCDGMVLWARQQLGTQLGLHSASPQSSVLDSDQLAWSLAIFLAFDKTLTMNLENRDFLKQAFKCLFSTQADGTWRHYRPLFHYKKSGNAYCYVFETFAVLLQCALEERAEAEMLRELLKPYCNNLMDLWRYADSTKIPVPRTPGGKEIGWCSGHRTNVTEPESWATASVFSYAQALRRLVGIWCREEVFANRKAPRTRQHSEDAAKGMAALGDTWRVDEGPVSERLWTMFVNPARMHECNDKLEPDSQPIQKNHARSAILFGPPGTGKTTLVRSLADLIEWDYVEIHASHFVAEGLPEVQKTADKIFKQLSELDHTVVLFDEIDELVRERDMEKDAFGRFLTTSMLPKLAELWEARNILYFVATNHINYFDSAIIRSHRFDALILVSPPSFEAKIDELVKLLSKLYRLTAQFAVSQVQIQEELKKVISGAPKSESPGPSQADEAPQKGALDRYREQKLDPKFALAKFALLRWDELDELAYRLAHMLPAPSTEPKIISADILRDALNDVADTEWRKNKSYLDYFRDTQSERRDYQMLNFWQVKDTLQTSVPDVVVANGSQWLAKTADSLKDIKIPGFELLSVPSGGVQIRVTGPR